MNRSIFTVAACLALSCCSRAPSSPPTPETSEADVPHATLPAGRAVQGASLYQISMELTDQDGQALGLDAFAGHPVIISMFYGSCPFACPTLISDVKRIVDKLEPATRKDVRVLLVSFDPERDTPAAMKELAERHRTDQTLFRFARSSEADVRKLAAVLGIRYKKLDNGAINHSTVITVLDRRGMPRYRMDGLKGPPDGAVSALERVDSPIARAWGLLTGG